MSGNQLRDISCCWQGNSYCQCSLWQGGEGGVQVTKDTQAWEWRGPRPQHGEVVSRSCPLWKLPTPRGLVEARTALVGDTTSPKAHARGQAMLLRALGMQMEKYVPPSP